MTRRAGITLIEVLVAIFIMGVGLLAILVLFPIGALSMARALNDDRAAQAAAQAAALANACDLRHDPAVENAFNATPGTPRPDQPSYPVLIDPVGAAVHPASGIAATGIARVTPTRFPAGPPIERWFMLLDDMNYNPDGTPVTTGTAPNFAVQRHGYYTWTLLARRPHHGDRSVVDLAVIVYRNRVTLSPEPILTVNAAKDATTVDITVTPGSEPELRTLGYLLDTTYLPSVNPGAPATVAGQGYQVLDIQKNGATWTLRIEPPLRNNANSMAVLEGAIGFFEKGNGWQP